MKKRTVLTVLAFVLLIAAVVVPTVLLTQPAGAEEMRGLVVTLDGGNRISGGTIYDSVGWRAFVDYVNNNREAVTKNSIYVNNDGVLTNPATLNYRDDGCRGVTFTLAADVIAEWGSGAISYFCGTLDGGRYTVTLNTRSSDDYSNLVSMTHGMKNPDNKYSYGGLFAVLDSGVVTNLRVSLKGTNKVSIKDISSDKIPYSIDIGALVGSMWNGAKLEKVQVSGLTSPGLYVSYFGKYNRGVAHPYFNIGLVGYSGSATISEVYTNVAIDTSMDFININTELTPGASFEMGGSINQGGILGFAASSTTIKDCYSMGSMSMSPIQSGWNQFTMSVPTAFKGTFRLGGIIGNGNAAASNTVSNCMVAGRTYRVYLFNSGGWDQDGSSVGGSNSVASKSVAQASAIGNLLEDYDNSNYCTTAALDSVLMQTLEHDGFSISLAGSNSNIFAVTSAGTVVSASYVPDKVVASTGSAYSGINDNGVWALDDSGALTLKWLKTPPPEVAVKYTDSDTTVSITRDKAFINERLYYFVKYITQGQFASAKGVLKGEGIPEVESIDLYLYEIKVDGNGNVTYLDNGVGLNNVTEITLKAGSTYQALAMVNGKNIHLLNNVTINWEVGTRNNTTASSVFSSTNSGRLTVSAGDVGKPVTITGTYGSSTIKSIGLVEVAPSVSSITVAAPTAVKYFMAGTTGTFTATVTGVGTPKLLWGVEGNTDSGTTVDSSGKLTVGANEKGRTDAVTGHEAGTVTVYAYYDSNANKTKDSDDVVGQCDVKIYKTPTTPTVITIKNSMAIPGKDVVVGVGDVTLFAGKSLTATVDYSGGSGHYTEETFLWSVARNGGALTSSGAPTTAVINFNTDVSSDSLNTFVSTAGMLTFSVDATVNGIKLAKASSNIYVQPNLTMTPGGGYSNYTESEVSDTVGDTSIKYNASCDMTMPASGSTSMTLTASLDGGASASTWNWNVKDKDGKEVSDDTKITLSRNRGTLTLTLSSSQTAADGDYYTVTATPSGFSPVQVTGAYNVYTFRVNIKRTSVTSTLSCTKYNGSASNLLDSGEQIYPGDTFTLKASLSQGTAVWNWTIKNPNNVASGNLVNGVTSAVAAQSSTVSFTMGDVITVPGTYIITVQPGNQVSLAQTFTVIVGTAANEVICTSYTHNGSSGTLAYNGTVYASDTFTLSAGTVDSTAWNWTVSPSGGWLTVSQSSPSSGTKSTTSTASVTVAPTVTVGSYTITATPVNYPTAAKIFVVNLSVTTGTAADDNYVISNLGNPVDDYGLDGFQVTPLSLADSRGSAVKKAAPDKATMKASAHPWWSEGDNVTFMNVKVDLPENLNGFDSNVVGGVNEPAFIYYVFGNDLALMNGSAGSYTVKPTEELSALSGKAVYDTTNGISWDGVGANDATRYLAVWVDAEDPKNSGLSASNVLVFDLRKFAEEGSLAGDTITDFVGEKNDATGGKNVTTDTYWSINSGENNNYTKPVTTPGNPNTLNTGAGTGWETWDAATEVLSFSVNTLKERIGDTGVLAPGSSVEVYAWMITSEPSTEGIGSGSATIGTRLAKPVISPNAAGEKIDNDGGVTISYPEDSTNVEIWYSVSYSDTSYEPLNSDGSVKASTAEVVIAEYDGKAIPFPSDKSTMTVTAMARDTKGARPVSYSTYVTYKNSDRATPAAIKVKLDGVDFDAGLYYTFGDSKITLYHESMDGKQPEGKILYTLNGSDPKTSGIEYVKGTEIDYVTGRTSGSAVELRAIFVPTSTAYKNSAVTSAAIKFKTAYQTPEVHIAYYDDNGDVQIGAKLKDGDTIEDGQLIALAVSEADIPSNMKSVIGYGIAESVAEDGSIVIKAGTESQTEKRVIFEGNDKYLLPQIKYALGNITSVSGITMSYAQETPKIINKSLKTVYERVAPQVITVSGAAGSSVTYSMYITGSDTDKVSSGILNITLKIRNNAKVPTALYGGKEVSGVTAVDVGSPIQLISSDLGTDIYYSTANNTMTKEDVALRMNWELAFAKWLESNKGLPSTEVRSKYTEDTEEAREYYQRLGNEEPVVQKYTQTLQVQQNSQNYLTISAMAVSSADADGDPNTIGNLGPSAISTFQFTINEVKQVEAVTAEPATTTNNPTEVKRGELISLASGTGNTTIYYTLDGSDPLPAERINYDKALSSVQKFGKDMLLSSETASLNKYLESGDLGKLSNSELIAKYVTGANAANYGPATKEYVSTEQISMAPKDGESSLSIRAMAVSTSGMMKNSAISRFDYDLMKAEKVTQQSTPVTATDDIITLAPESSIRLRTKTLNADIYYTTNGTVPDPLAYNAASEADREKMETKLYDFDTGLTMPGDIKTFYIVSAVAYVPNGEYAASELATFTYQLPAPVQAVYATPVAGSVVKGTEVTLKTTTEGATIYYETGKASNLKANKSQTFDEGTPIKIDANMTIYTMAVKDGVKSEVTSFKYTVAETLPTPTPSIPTGSVVGKGTSIKLTSKEGATIVYTTDGSDPTKADNKALMYGDTVLLNGDYGAAVSVQAYATKTGYTPSEIMTATYTIATNNGYLTVSPATGSTIANGTVVNMTTTLTGSTIHYTTDGTDPTASSPSGNSVAISGAPGATVNLKVSVFDSSGKPGTTTLVTYKIQEKASAPSSSVESGAYFMEGATIKLTAAEGLIYYTTDGSDPTTSSSLYGDIAKLGNDVTAYPDITLRDSSVIKAIAVVSGKANSDIAQFVYTKAGQVSAPTFSVTSGEIDQNSAISLETATEGASIYYSTKGTDPSAGNLDSLTLYTGPITVTRPVTIKAIAIKDQLHSSMVNTATYTVKVPEPVDEGEGAGDIPAGTNSDRLTSRRTYSDTDTGPSFKDVVISNADFGMLVSAKTGVIPKDCELVITEINPGTQDVSAASSVNGEYGIAQLYEIKLMRNGEEIQPEGEIEIGMPIDSDYQNATLEIVQINSNGTAKLLDARRAGGMAYVMTDSLYRYAITMPKDQIKKDNTWIWVAGVAGAGVVGGGVAMLVLGKKKKDKKGPGKPAAQAGPKPAAPQSQSPSAPPPQEK